MSGTIDNTSFDGDDSFQTKILLEKQFERANKIYKALKFLVEPGAVTELRAFEVAVSETYTAKTISGYYDCEHLYDLALKADELTKDAPGVYYTLNPIDPEMLSHRCNRTEQNPKSATKDSDILRLVRLFVDIDPTRYSKTDGRKLEGNISATNAEKDRAYNTAGKILDDLGSAGWPRPVFVDSGNGYYLIYKINLPTDKKELVERCLKALAARYDSKDAIIDPSVFNPSRIAKIPGTLAGKGDPTPDRPHRQSSIVSVPEVWSCVPTERLEALAAQAPLELPRPTKKHHQTATTSKPAGGKYDHIVTNTKLAATTPKASVEDRVRAYLEKVPPSISGDHGHNRLFHAAMVIVDRFAVQDYDTAYELLAEFNEKGDPEDERQLHHKLESAFDKVDQAGGPSCDLLNEDVEPEIYPLATTPVAGKPNNPNYDPGPTVRTDIEVDKRPKILVDNNLHVIRADILNVIQDDLDLYKRGYVLTKFTQLETDEAKLKGGVTLRNAKGTYALAPIDEASFACHLSAMAYFYKEKTTPKGNVVEVQCDPPATPLRAVLNNKAFKGVRPIQGVVECPYLLPDGSLCEPGYNADTETIYIPTVELDPLPENPTQKDAETAATRIFDYVKEFPFRDPNLDRAVWLAHLLTAIMRPAIPEAAPGVAYIGNTAGVGKGLLVHTVGILATGRPVPATSYPLDKEEARKVKVTLALSGVQLVLLDDLDEGQSYGNGPLDSMITETKIGNERVLGTMQQTGEIHLRPTWCLNGNNLAPARDAHRRWLICNIVTELEHPEERKVEREDLLDQVHKHRATLLRDALIVLKAHAVAGYPKGDWAPLGSFYKWDKIVRGAVWYATNQDCNQTRQAAANESPERLRKLALLEALEAIQNTFIDGGQPYKNGVTTSDILALASETEGSEHMGNKTKYTYPDLHTAVTAFPAENRKSLSQILGGVITGLKNKTLDGKRLIKNGERNHSAIWLVTQPPQ